MLAYKFNRLYFVNITFSYKLTKKKTTLSFINTQEKIYLKKQEINNHVKKFFYKQCLAIFEFAMKRNTISTHNIE